MTTSCGRKSATGGTVVTTALATDKGPHGEEAKGKDREEAEEDVRRSMLDLLQEEKGKMMI